MCNKSISISVWFSVIFIPFLKITENILITFNKLKIDHSKCRVDICLIIVNWSIHLEPFSYQLLPEGQSGQNLCKCGITWYYVVNMQYLIDNKIWPATPWFWKQKGLVILNSKEKYVHNHEILLEMQCLCFLNGHFTHKQKQKHTHTPLWTDPRAHSWRRRRGWPWSRSQSGSGRWPTKQTVY